MQELCKHLEGSSKVVLLGNGGIALEFVGAVDFLEVTWAIKDNYIGNTFLDASASEFLIPRLSPKSLVHKEWVSSIFRESRGDGKGIKRRHETIPDDDADERIAGNAIGPRKFLCSKFSFAFI